MRVEGIRGRRFSSRDVLFGFDFVFGPILILFIWFSFGLVLVLLVWFGFDFVKVKLKKKKKKMVHLCIAFMYIACLG